MDKTPKDDVPDIRLWYRRENFVGYGNYEIINNIGVRNDFSYYRERLYDKVEYQTYLNMKIRVSIVIKYFHNGDILEDYHYFNPRFKRVMYHNGKEIK